MDAPRLAGCARQLIAIGVGGVGACVLLVGAVFLFLELSLFDPSPYATEADPQHRRGNVGLALALIAGGGGLVLVGMWVGWRARRSAAMERRRKSSRAASTA